MHTFAYPSSERSKAFLWAFAASSVLKRAQHMIIIRVVSGDTLYADTGCGSTDLRKTRCARTRKHIR